MLIKVLHSKVRFAVVTDSNMRYNGSIGIGKNIMEELGWVESQVLNVNSIDGSVRTETYIIAEEKDNVVVVRGALAAMIYKGDVVHLNCYVMMSPESAKFHKPIIIETNKR